jgi:hypothetical protein
LRVGAAVLHQKTLAEELREYFDMDEIEGEAIELEPETPKPKRRRPASRSVV